MSTYTGPRGQVIASSAAAATARTDSSAVRGRSTALASGSKSAAWSRDSWSAPRITPGRASFVEISLATSTNGVPEDAASPNAATALAAPGPVVVRATPSPPDARARPSAAYTAVCSCRTTTSAGVPGPASRQSERLCTPGSPKAVVTPARWNTSSTARATVVIVWPRLDGPHSDMAEPFHRRQKGQC